MCVSTRVHVCVFHHPCTTRPSTGTPVFSKPAARRFPAPTPSCMRLAAAHQCVLDKKLPHQGTLYLVPSPLPAVLCYSHGGFSLAPSTIYCFPRGLGAKALSEVPSGAPQGQPSSTPTRPPCRACVGVEVMASVDIVTSVSVT